jgi:hypothetical protein
VRNLAGDGYAPKKRTRIDLDLGTAGSRVIDRPGTVIWVNDVTGGTAKVEAQFDDEPQTNAVILRRDYFYRGQPWQRLTLFWAAQAGITMIIQLIQDTPDDTVGIL